MAKSNFISQEEALKHVGADSASFVDCSWYLPAQKRDGFKEFQNMRIPEAVYFDIDAIADKDTDLPHMLPSPQEFAQAASVLGLSKDRLIIVYDGPGLFSAPRVWWALTTMGAKDVRILEGGFDAWKEKDRPIETGNPNPPNAQLFEPNFEAERVIDQDTLVNLPEDTETVIIDARSIARFEGKAAEPRPGLRSGHIPNSKSVPFTMLMDGNKLKSPDALREIFANLGISENTHVVTTCGSGVTAAILTLALEESGLHNHRLFDGSWAQWGKQDGPNIETL